jgi:hypothetical protein
MNRGQIGLVAALMLVPLSTQAAERDVSFQVDGKKVVGTLNIPEGRTRPPVVLLLHGFAGSRNELPIPAAGNEGVYHRTARMLAEKGIASLRIDFMGRGDSEGDYGDTTLQIEIADASAALDYLASREDLDKSNMSIIGWSLGGAVAASVAGRTHYSLASVVLWEPANNPANAMAFFYGTDVVKKGLNAGASPVETRTPWGMTFYFRQAFFRSLSQVDPVAESRSYHGPLLVTSGTDDDVVFPQPESAQIFLKYHDGPGELWIHPMDHVFNAFKGHETVDEVIAKTIDFVEKSKR